MRKFLGFVSAALSGICFFSGLAIMSGERM
mgnify:CR=1 FL=1|jgi:hypothetical protein